MRTTPSVFDPLVEFISGVWTTVLAERYLPIDGLPAAKYECLDGHLIMSPRGHSGIGCAIMELRALLREPAGEIGAPPYPMLAVAFDPQCWIEPDLVVLRHQVRQVHWVPAELMLMPVVFLPSDRIDRPALCAAAGVPCFMTVEIGHDDVVVELSRLDDSGRYVTTHKGRPGGNCAPRCRSRWPSIPADCCGSAVDQRHQVAPRGVAGLVVRTHPQHAVRGQRQ
jgi:hypothetical protein